MQKAIRRVAVVVNCKAGTLLDCANAEEVREEAFARAGSILCWFRQQVPSL